MDRLSVYFQQNQNRVDFVDKLVSNKLYMKSIQLIGHAKSVPIDSIVWLEGESSYTRVHFKSGNPALVTQPLQWFEQFSELIRIHRSAIINPIYVKEFVQKRGRSGSVRLFDDREIPVARTRLELIAARLMPILLPSSFLTDQPDSSPTE